jgi:hypothetical protein
MVTEGRRRVVIEHVHPEIDWGNFPINRVVGERVVVQADIFADGHDTVSARLLYKGPHDGGWKEVPMKYIGDIVGWASLLLRKWECISILLRVGRIISRPGRKI